MLVIEPEAVATFVAASKILEVVVRFGSDYLYLTALFVIMGILRYMQITFVEENSGSPTKLLLKDRFLQLTLVGWVASFGLIKLL